MIIKSVLLPLNLADAFKLLTDQISQWWPPDRRHTKDADSLIFLQADGRFFERASDGKEVEMGRVLAWRAPHRILLDFYIATGKDHPTEVEITLAAEGDGTRVTIKHSAKPESAHLWDKRAPRYVSSWDAVLAALEAAARK
jgi:uncharacterized protein YndB with AHSA1/START domain